MRSIERRRSISMCFGEDNTALGNDAVDVKDGAGNELLEQIKGLLVAELVEPVPQLVGVINFLHADAGGLRARLEQPGVGYAGHEFAELVVIEDVDEFGDEDAGFTGAGAHGQLVAKVADSGEAHAGDAEMLAEGGNILHVEFIQSDDAIDGMGPGGKTHGVNQVLQREILGHGEDFVYTFERPIGVAKFFDGQEKDNTAHGFAGADEFLAFFVGTDAKNGERPVLRHATLPGNEVNRARIIQRLRAQDKEIAGTVRRAAPKLLRCAWHLQRPRNVNRVRASSPFRAARREISRLAERCADLRACRYP